MSNEHGYHGNTENHLARLRRIEGQVRGLQRMISQGEYCIDILTQVSAVQSALDSVAVNLLKDHMNHCVVTAAPTRPRRPKSTRRPRPSRASSSPNNKEKP